MLAFWHIYDVGTVLAFWHIYDVGTVLAYTFSDVNFFKVKTHGS